MSQPFLRIRTAIFPILDGEDDEVVNPGTFGKAFAQYLQTQLGELGYDCPFVCGEDWGWWVEWKLPEKATGIACYRHHDKNTDCDFVCTPGLSSNLVWSWRRFRKVDLSDQLDKLVADLKQIFESDPDIKFIGVTDEFPF